MGFQYSSHLSLSSAPRLVWHAYIEYLWNPHPGSWVSQVAYSFRVLAFLLILPVVILTLLVRQPCHICRSSLLKLLISDSLPGYHLLCDRTYSRYC
ncbi:hypothetical protein BDR05DRAFT_968947 [Suillus weaverae]|nr:hypothetical protein BDR05DRAFT_968947 [Suillus weaverae]